MYVYSYCNALSARFFAVDRALNSYFMIIIMNNNTVLELQHHHNTEYQHHQCTYVSLYSQVFHINTYVILAEDTTHLLSH